MLGTLGSLLVLVAFAAVVLSGVAYVLATREPAAADTWQRVGRGAWGVGSGGVLGAFALLVVLFLRHDYRYAYVYQHSSNDLPTYFTVSAAWAGQEGSFLLWIVMTALLGGGLILALRRGRWTHFEAPVLALIALGQAFMLSMVLGLKLGPLTVGASPFITLIDKFPDAPFLQAGGVPADGSGLNDLLQNYWMTIHPPTLFVGFTLTMAPFAFAIAGLWQRRYTEWIRPAMPWALAAGLVLATGIMMGGYWAYVTLSFGGWWAWDPVENSSLVPWLFGVAGLHAMLVARRRGGYGVRAAFSLVIAAFIFVVYSTFLTRSGILGDVSVHSFVDLGLYNQLLLWISTMAALGFGLLAVRFRELPQPVHAPASMSREGMIFTGALVLALIGGVIIVGTSAPILGRIFRDNPAAVATSFYDAWTLPLAVALAGLAGLGQLFWWKKMRVEDVNRAIMKPLGLAVVSTAAVLMLTPFVPVTVEPAQVAAEAPRAIEAGLFGAGGWERFGTSLLLLMLVFAAFFALYGNGAVLWRIARGNLKMAGGSLAHVGMALMLLGIVASSVFNDAITDGQGANIRGDRDNFIVERGETKRVEGFAFTYVGQRTNERGRPVYDLDVVDHRGRAYRASAEVYQSKSGQWIQHPHVEPFIEEDLYMAVYPAAMMRPTGDEDQAGELTLERAQAAPLDDGAFTVRFTAYDLDPDRSRIGVPPDSLEIAVGAVLEVTERATGQTRTLRPIYAVTTAGEQRYVQNRVPEWGLAFTFAGMQVEQDAVRLVVEGARTAPEDWLVVQAYRKPFINVLWLGTLVLMLGFGISVFRRVSEQRGR